MAGVQGSDNVYREALYVGSFHVEDTDQKSRIRKVRDELETLHVFNKSKKVMICISVRGIKICSPNCETVFMAHALRRVSYVTCDANHKQVAFLAREPAGEANSQYCHVFVTITSSQAEELNRIVGDAFQLAYVRQRMLKMQRNGSEMSSPELQPIPRLCDRYSPWIQQPATETSPNTEASEKTNFVSSPAPVLPLVLELPPPPSCPPPPPKNNDPNTSLTHCSSSPELTVPPKATVPTGLDGSTDPVSRDQMTTNVLTPTKMRISESNPSRTGLSTNLANVNGHDNHHDHQLGDPRNNGISNECNGSNDLDSRLRRISTPHVTDMAFLRRHFLRRSEGKRLSSVADTQLIGGSTRQPRHRPGAGLSGLFSQVRHSAFFPSATANISDPIEVEKPRRDQPDTHTPSADWLGLLGTPNPTQKTHIFVDLRTFAGGSPVVALKERLDAQAVADAKASAFAEAAAVLAAAKLASESSNSSCTNSSRNASGNSCNSPHSNTRPSRDLYPILSSPTAVPNSIICSNGSGGSGGNWDGLKQVSETSGINEPESPPVPPVRLHSLGRGPQRPLPQTPGGGTDAPKPFTVRGGFRMDASTTCLSEEDVTGGGGTDLHHTSASESTASSPGGRILSNGHGQDHPIAPFLPTRSSATSSASSFFGDCAISSGILHQPSNFSESHQASPSCSSGKGSAFAVSDRRTRNADRPDTRRFSYGPHSPVLRPMESGGQWTTARNPHRPHEHVLFPDSMPGPLHVIAEGYVPNQPWPVGALVSDPSVVHPVSTAPIMSSSTISAETPTPTATPTPTPSQTPQPFGSHVLISREDSEFLRHAPWYQALLPRDLAFELLAREDIGSFIVRNSVTHPDCCALSVRVPQQNNPTGITHYLIQRTQNGVRLKGLDKEWPSLRALITHLTVMPEMLPCLLRMPVHANNPVFTQLDEPRGDWDPAHTVHRGSSQDSRSHRVATGPISLQPVTSLPSRPVPPTCASRSYLTTSFAALKGSSTCRVPTVGQSDVHEGRSHSIQFSKPPSDLDSVDAIKRKSHSLGAKAQCVSEDAREVLCKYDGATTTQQSDKSRTRLFRDDDDLVSQECWSRPNASSPFDDGDEDEDEDYQRLSDFSSMMADLKPARDTEVTSC